MKKFLEFRFFLLFGYHHFDIVDLVSVVLVLASLIRPPSSCLLDTNHLLVIFSNEAYDNSETGHASIIVFEQRTMKRLQ